MDSHSNDLLRMPLKEPSDNTSSHSSYSPYAFPSELKSAHSNGPFSASLFRFTWLILFQQTTRMALPSLIL